MANAEQEHPQVEVERDFLLDSEFTTSLGAHIWREDFDPAQRRDTELTPRDFVFNDANKNARINSTFTALSIEDRKRISTSPQQWRTEMVGYMRDLLELPHDSEAEKEKKRQAREFFSRLGYNAEDFNITDPTEQSAAERFRQEFLVPEKKNDAAELFEAQFMNACRDEFGNIDHEEVLRNLWIMKEILHSVGEHIEEGLIAKIKFRSEMALDPDQTVQTLNTRYGVTTGYNLLAEDRLRLVKTPQTVALMALHNANVLHGGHPAHTPLNLGTHAPDHLGALVPIRHPHATAPVQATPDHGTTAPAAATPPDNRIRAQSTPRELNVEVNNQSITRLETTIREFKDSHPDEDLRLTPEQISLIKNLINKANAALVNDSSDVARSAHEKLQRLHRHFEITNVVFTFDFDDVLEDIKQAKNIIDHPPLPRVAQPAPPTDAAAPKKEKKSPVRRLVGKVKSMFASDVPSTAQDADQDPQTTTPKTEEEQAIDLGKTLVESYSNKLVEINNSPSIFKFHEIPPDEKNSIIKFLTSVKQRTDEFKMNTGHEAREIDGMLNFIQSLNRKLRPGDLTDLIDAMRLGVKILEETRGNPLITTQDQLPPFIFPNQNASPPPPQLVPRPDAPPSQPIATLDNADPFADPHEFVTFADLFPSHSDDNDAGSDEFQLPVPNRYYDPTVVDPNFATIGGRSTLSEDPSVGKMPPPDQSASNDQGGEDTVDESYEPGDDIQEEDDPRTRPPDTSGTEF